MSSPLFLLSLHEHMDVYCQELWDIIKLPFPNVSALMYDLDLTLFYRLEEEEAHTG